MKKYSFTIYCILCLFISTAKAQYTDLHDFDITHGEYSYCSLNISGGKLFGMTYSGGANGAGCIFSMDTNGANY